MASKNSSFFLISTLLLILVLPFGFIMYQHALSGIPLDWPLVGKWVLFWGVGARLFLAGLKQVINPAYTAKEVFRFRSSESYLVIRELGFAHICFGVIAMLSLLKPVWIPPAAIAGGLYSGFAGVQHIPIKLAGRDGTIALVSEVGVFFMMSLYLFYTL